MHRLALGFDAELSKWLRRRVPHFYPSEGVKCVGVIRNNKLVAAVAYSGFFPGNEHWSPDVEMTAAADTPRWWSRSVGADLLGIPFRQFGCERVTLRVRKKDKRTRRFVEGIGFKLEGILRRALRSDDACLYGLTKADWERGKYV